MEKDIFVHNVINDRDYKHLGFFILLAVILIFSFLISSNFKDFSSIYLPIFFVSLFILIGAIISKGQIFGEVVFGKDNNNEKVYRDILVGILFGSFFVISYSIFFVGVPPPDLSNGLPLTQLFVAGILAVEIEEMFRASILVPTVISFLKNEGEWAVISLLVGAMMFFLFNSTIIAFLFFAFALLLIFNQETLFLFKKLQRIGSITKNWTQKTDIIKHVVGILFAGFVFAIFHAYAYNNSFTLLEGAFEFAIIADAINWWLQSTIASRVAHSINNSFIVGLQFGLYLQSLLIIFIYILIILSASMSVRVNLGKIVKLPEKKE